MRCIQPLLRAALALALLTPVGCSRTDENSEDTMNPDVAELATRALRRGDEGLDARRRLDDLANWEHAIVDLRPAGPILLAGLRDADPAVRHRALDAIARLATHTARGHAVGFLDRSLPPHVERPFYLDALPAIAAASRSGGGEARAESVEALAAVALAARPALSADALAPLSAAAEAAARDSDPRVAEAGRAVVGQLATLGSR